MKRKKLIGSGRRSSCDTFVEKLANKQARQALDSVWIADGKCLDGITHTGIYDRHYAVPTGQNRQLWQLEVADRVVNLIASSPLSWTVWYGTFGIKDGRKVVTGVIKTFPPAVSNDLGDDVHNMLQKLVDSRNSKHLISYGWIATPKQNVDLDLSEEEIIAKFDVWGAFDKELCNLTHMTRSMSEAKKAAV